MFSIIQKSIRYFTTFETENGKLKHIFTPEGKAPPMKKGFEYQYFLKVEAKRKSASGVNHLGNTRVVLSQTGKTLQQNGYYPFGMLMAGLPQPEEYHDNKYLYNGKELQDDFELGWYDYGARFYDAGLGRFTGVDPLADERVYLTPYNYAQNNSVSRIDPDGALDTKYEDEKGNLLLETNDGSDAVIKITDDKRKGFDAAVKGTENTDDVAWNKTMKKYALGFELSEKQESLLSSINSDWSRKAAIDYWKTGETSAGIKFVLKEVLSQWTNPELVVAGLSAGVAGYSPKLRSISKNVDNAANSAKNWLGKDYKAITNKAGDNIFISKDGMRKMRFDIKNSHGDKPHIHLEQKINEKWKGATNIHRIYPKIK